MAQLSRFKMSQERLDALKDELYYLETVREKEVAEQIKEARSFGDLSENAEYDAAKIEQARMEYEIVEIEAMLRNVVIIDEDNINTDVVNVGNTITVKNKTLNQELTFQIVGSAEANPMEKRISNESPVGKGLLGHKLHETVSIQTPGGPAEFEILNISK